MGFTLLFFWLRTSYESNVKKNFKTNLKSKPKHFIEEVRHQTTAYKKYYIKLLH